MLLQKADDQNNKEAIKLLNVMKNSSPIPMWPLEFIPQEYNKKAEKLIEWMIKNGANVNPKNSKGKTPLHNATFFYSEKAVKALCENGADVNATDDNGFTPLHYATVPPEKKYARGEGKIKVVQDEVKLNVIKILIDKGADPKIVSVSGETPMDFLNSKQKAEIEEYIAEIAFKKAHGVDVYPLDVSNEVKDSTSIEQEDPDMKILEEALRELEGESS